MNTKSIHTEASRPGTGESKMRPIQDALGAHRLPKRGALLSWATLFTLSAIAIHITGVLLQPPVSWLLVALLLVLTIAQLITAIATVIVPARRLLLVAGVVEVIALLAWIFAHTTGLPDGSSVWRSETLGSLDLYLPELEGFAAFFYLCLLWRTWMLPRGLWRTLQKWLPTFALALLLVLGLLNQRVATILVVAFILNGQVPVCLQYVFLPAVGLLALFLLLRLVIPRLRVRTQGAWLMALILLPALLVTTFFTWGGVLNAANVAWFPETSMVVAPAGRTTTLEYCRPNGGSPLAMDITEPSVQALHPAPAVFYITGGGTFQGSRSLQTGATDDAYFTHLRDELVTRGFVVGALDYSLVPLYKVSDQVKDAKCAVRFLRAHASELGIDPQRIGVYGPSQGGYISAMLGTAGLSAGYDVGQYLNQSSRVQAVVDMWGPVDLTNFSGSPSWIAALTGGGSSATLKAATPFPYIRSDDPPFLIMHGTDDWFIAPHHSQKLAAQLHAAGVPVTLVMIQHGSHGLAAAGPDQNPSPNTLVQMTADFFTHTLGGK